MTPPKPIAVAQDILGELLAKMGVEANVEILSEEPPTLNIALDSPGALIGHRGDGLKSLQHLVRLFLIKQNHELPVIIDIEGYRAKQQEQLEQLAKRKAEEVRSSGRLAVLSPMSSYERRLVHMAVADYEDVVTESLGEGQNRRVMIKKKE